MDNSYKRSDPRLRLLRRGYADLSARPRSSNRQSCRVPLNCTQSHSAEWKNGTWPSKMGLSHQKWDCPSPSPIILVYTLATPSKKKNINNYGMMSARTFGWDNMLRGPKRVLSVRWSEEYFGFF